MVRQPRESVPASPEVESLNPADEAAEANAGSRRDFLQLGAFAAFGLASGCGTTAVGDDDASAGTAGSSGTNPGAGTGGTSMMGNGGTGTGGSTGGGAPMQGGSSGTGTGGGTAGGGAGKAAGGAGPAGAGPGGGAGASTGGAPAGGAGGMNGGSPATGGAPPGGGAGMATGGSGGMGNTGMGGKENNYTPLPMLPDGTHGPSNKMLPDPFKYLDGTRISSKADWERLRADLSAKLQAAVYGPKMPPPDTLKATLSGSTVTVNMTVGTKTGSFTFSVSGGSASAPKPAVLKCDGSGVPFPSSVVSIRLDAHTFAQENKMIPTSGLVSTLYGNTAAKCGSDICWAWGASRIIDALEQLPEAGIDTTKIATTGCSYAGKGGLAMGIFDERVALTVMQEGGSGGTACWRISTKEASLGQNIQEATEIVGEQNWQGADFKALFSGKDKKTAPVDMLIADMHFCVALAAPRGFLIIENDIDWLGPLAAYGGGKAGLEVYKALGVGDRCGISVAANHGHCQFPSSQQADLTKFVNRFLLGMKTDTGGVDVLNATNSKIKTWTPADWIDWDTPTLAGELPWDPWK